MGDNSGSESQALGVCAEVENTPYQAGRELCADYLCGSSDAFVNLLATSLLPRGYWFYVKGRIPEDKNPQEVDRKILDKYEINLSKWARRRRAVKGEAKLRYLRFERDFILIATHGKNRFYDHEGKQVKDARIKPIKWRGYSLSARQDQKTKKWHSLVRMQLHVYQEYKARILKYAAKVQKPGWWYGFFWNIPYMPYAGVNKQKFDLLRKVNRVRKTGGLEQIKWDKAIKFKRRAVKIYIEPEAEVVQTAKE
jgi:hypothetical protein